MLLISAYKLRSGEWVEGFLNILSKLGYAPEQCITIGDRYEKDVVPPKSLGIQTIFKNNDGRGDIEYSCNDGTIIARFDNIFLRRQWSECGRIRRDRSICGGRGDRGGNRGGRDRCGHNDATGAAQADPYQHCADAQENHQKSKRKRQAQVNHRHTRALNSFAGFRLRAGAEFAPTDHAAGSIFSQPGAAGGAEFGRGGFGAHTKGDYTMRQDKAKGNGWQMKFV